jgi:uncharacterized XkdX family phage protein
MALDWYTVVKRYYERGYYTNNEVKLFVQAGKITPEQYEEITGEPYVE